MTQSRQIRISMENASKRNGGVFEGWGSSLCWWAHRVGYSQQLTDKAAALFYGDEGLRLNIMRYNIGGGDDPSHHHITRTDSKIPGWWEIIGEPSAVDGLPPFLLNETADRNQLNTLLACSAAAGETAYVEAFSNSAPYFMTYSGCTSGATRGEDNNLREECVQQFADYLGDVIAYLEIHKGITVKSLSPMNEPNTSFWYAGSPKQEGCHVDPGKCQSDILTATKIALLQRRLKHVVLAGSDETNAALQLEACEKYSAEALQSIDRISTHTYQDHGRKEMCQWADKTGMNLWMSEVDGSGVAGEEAGEMGAGLWFVNKIMSDINELSPSAWVMWLLIDNHISELGYQGNIDKGMVDLLGGYWGVAVANHDAEEILLTQKYYAFGQVTRFIRPGMTIIHCGEGALAAYDSVQEQLILVAVNDKREELELQVLSEGFSLQEQAIVEAFRTSGDLATGEHWKKLEDLNVSGNAFQAYLKGNSVTTFVCHNVKK